MNPATSENPRGQREGQDHQPNQGTQPIDPDEAYFGQRHAGYVEGQNSGMKLAVIALLIIGATAVGLALIFRSVDKTANTGNGNSLIAEQNRLMREAMQMARESQAMNRQRMMEMQRAMQEAEGYAEQGSDPGAGSYGSDP